MVATKAGKSSMEQSIANDVFKFPWPSMFFCRFDCFHSTLPKGPNILDRLSAQTCATQTVEMSVWLFQGRKICCGTLY